MTDSYHGGAREPPRVPRPLGHVHDAEDFRAIDLDAESAWWRALPLQPFTISGVSIANRFLLAPMCDVTNLPYRVIARAEGASLLASEMLSSVALSMGGQRSFRMMEFLPSEQPIMVQISGTDGDVMLRAAELIQEYGAPVLNLNCGCPVKKVIKGGSGSALLRNPEVLRVILRTLRPHLSIPLTVKLRGGWDASSVNAVEVSKMCEDEGVDAVMLHPRTRSQMYEGHANWDLIAEVKRALSVPVIGNGDIFEASDAFAMMEQTGCDAVMIGRGAIGNPWIFRQCVLEEARRAGLDSPATSVLPDPWPTLAERRATITRHFDLFAAYAGEGQALRAMRKQLMAYVRGLRGASVFRASVADFTSRPALFAHLDAFFDGAAAA